MSTGQATSHGHRFVPGVEWLEDRTVPDGNVNVALGAQVLYVTGDEAANRIWIEGFGTTSVVIRPLDTTTTINGNAGPLFLDSIKEGYHVSLLGGDDRLIVSNTRHRRGVNVDTGEGNDTLELFNTGHRGATVLKTGGGNDTVNLNLGVFRQDVVLDTGTGDDQVTADQLRGPALYAVNPLGTDFFDNRRTSFKRFEQAGFLSGTQPPPVPPVLDVAAPAVALASDAPDVTGPGAIDFTATFNEDVFGFSAAGIAVTNGSVTAFTPIDARTYRFSVTPDGDGIVSATVSAGAATDAAGNANTASQTVSRTVDATAPATPTLALDADDDSGPDGDLRTDQTTPVDLTGTAEANSTVTLVRATSGTAPGTGAVVATTTAAANGTFTFSVQLDLGPNSFAVRATDAVGNASGTFAQTFTRNAPPAAVSLPTQELDVGVPEMLDLTTAFTDAERIVRFSVQYPNPQTGVTLTQNLDINLFADDAPATVANFLAYVNNGNPDQTYNGSIFHRLARGFVLQGGGFKFDNTNKTFPAIPKLPMVINEPGTSNTLGTIALAKVPAFNDLNGNGTQDPGEPTIPNGGPDSATNEFFFNLGDNSANLDVQNGGFTAFGQVMNGGLPFLTTLNQLNTFPGPGLPGAPPFPVGPNANTNNFPQNINATDLATVMTATDLTTTPAERMTFDLIGTGTSDPTVATVTLTGASLTITPVGAGTATIMVQATDLDGSVTTNQITVNVS